MLRSLTGVYLEHGDAVHHVEGHVADLEGVVGRLDGAAGHDEVGVPWSIFRSIIYKPLHLVRSPMVSTL